MARCRVLVDGTNVAGPALAVPGVAGLRLGGPARPDVVTGGVVNAATHAGRATAVRRE